MNKASLRQQLHTVVTDPKSNDREKLVANSILHAFDDLKVGNINTQWIVQQLKKLAEKSGVTLDPPPKAPEVGP